MEIKIESIAYYLPEQSESRDILVEDNPDWRMDAVEAKTGVLNRFVSSEDETALDLAVKAGQRLFENYDRSNVDAVIYVTQSPEHVLPTSACILQDRLELPTHCMAFDINLGCSGFVYGLSVSASLINSAVAKNVLLICSDTYTKYINKNDRVCRPLFSDGAAAVLVSSESESNLGPFVFGTDGSGAESLIVRNNAQVEEAESCSFGELFMDGSQVFMFTMDKVPKAVDELLEKSGLYKDDIDLFIFHQASKLVIDNIVRRMDLPESKVFRNYQRHGNTVSATIPIALKDALDEGLIENGSKILLAGFGVGLSWGATILEW